MLTKRTSALLSIVAGVWMGTAMLTVLLRGAYADLGIFSSWMYLSQYLLLLFPMAVPITNMSYKDKQLSKATSITQIVFFAACFAFGAGVLAGLALAVNLSLLGLALLALIALIIKVAWMRVVRLRAEFKGPGSRKRLTANIIALLTSIWLPASLFINPGWGSLMLFTPYVFVLLLPIIVVLSSNSSPSRKRLFPTSVLVWEVIFCLLSCLVGVFYVNGGDAEVASILSRLFGDLWGNDFTLRLSSLLLQLTVYLALSLLPVVILYRQSDNRIFSKILPVACSVVFVIASLGFVSLGFTGKAQSLKTAANLIEQDNIVSASGKRISYDVKGDGFLGQLQCDTGSTCPTLDEAWVVPVESGKEWEFIWNIMQKQGYVSMDPVFPCSAKTVTKGGDCSTWGVKLGSELRIKIRQATPQETPQQPVDPKKWRVVEISLTNYDFAPDRQGQVYPAPED